MNKQKTNVSILLVMLFFVQFLFSRFGFFISQIFDYSSLDPDNIICTGSGYLAGRQSLEQSSMLKKAFASAELALWHPCRHPLLTGH